VGRPPGPEKNVEEPMWMGRPPGPCFWPAAGQLCVKVRASHCLEPNYSKGPGLFASISEQFPIK